MARDFSPGPSVHAQPSTTLALVLDGHRRNRDSSLRGRSLSDPRGERAVQSIAWPSDPGRQRRASDRGAPQRHQPDIRPACPGSRPRQATVALPRALAGRRSPPVTGKGADRAAVGSNRMFERYTERARQVVVYAQDEPRTLGHDYIGTEHILLGLARENEGVAARILLDFDADPERIRSKIGELRGDRGPQAPPARTPASRRERPVRWEYRIEEWPPA